MFRVPNDDKSKDKNKSNQAHLGGHLTDFITDMTVRGGNKEDFDANFKAKTWKGKPKNDPNKKK